MNSESLIGVAPGLDEPLEILEACHGRIENQLVTLERLVAHLREKDVDESVRKAIASVVRYFESAGAHHHEDEEIDLFPHLSKVTGGTVDGLIGELLSDHILMGQGWIAVKEALLEVNAGISVVLDEVKINVFADIYRRHIQRENHELLPLARAVLSAADLKSLSLSMTNRRRH